MRNAAFATLAFGVLFVSQASASDFSALTQPLIRQSSSDESIYFVMTDRFENGDQSNDNAGLTGGSSLSGFDPSDPGYWHGGDFKGLTRHVGYIKSLGFTAIWITPPVKQKYIQSNSGGYHGYWGLDFTTVDPHLGTEADFKEFVKTAHNNELKVIIDVVANHTADVIYNYFGKPTIHADEVGAKKPDWLNDINNYHNQGNGSGFTSDFYGLDDIATEKPIVVNGWIQVWSDWITKFDIDGLRIDTFKYVEPEFWKKVIPAIKEVARKAGKKDFPIFGEVYDRNPYATSSYVTSKQIDSVLDFPFQDRVMSFAAYGGNTMELAMLFNSDDLYTTANTNAYGLITFLGNHDMGRIGYFIRDAVLEGDVSGALERAQLANALLFYLRGSPALYYGDEKGLAGVGGDKQARQDLFPTKVLDWQSQPRIGSPPIGTQSSFDIVNPLQLQVTKIQSIIAANPALRNGTQQVRTSEGEVFVVTRYLKNQEYFAAFNGSDETSTATFEVGTSHSNWLELDGKCKVRNSDSISVQLAPRSYCVYKAQKKYSSSSRISVSVSARNIDFFAQYGIALTAAVPGNGYNTVTFSYRLKGGKWFTIGTADKRTVSDLETKKGFYRVYLQKEGLRPGTKVDVIAVAKSASGVIAVSKIIPVTLPR